MEDFSRFMVMAIEEAELSLREGNCGFGAVIIKDEAIVAKSHDTEKTAADPTAHAELTAIRKAAASLGRHLDSCQIISTHEPCPMCATAIFWSGIETVVYGYSIREALQQGRSRIDLSCREIFQRAGKAVTIHEGVLHDRCAVLYNNDVREQIKSLRNADEATLRQMADALTAKRLSWFEANRPNIPSGDDLVETAYRLLIHKLDIPPQQAPILDQGPRHIRFASRNFCPTLEACRILGLDTRLVCKHLTEGPTNEFLRQLHPKLRFSRNYDTLRPYGEYCEEVISLEERSL
jgi:tRNA(Arg) A34 adenosine deaminase TadA/transcriptional regulator with XRE-family HTH domain